MSGLYSCARRYLLASVYGMPTTETGPASQTSRAQRFAGYIRPAVVAAGYDIDSPRGGGKKELADATGMSPSSVGRMLAGATLPDPVHLERLAEVLHLDFMDLLVESGLLSSRRGGSPVDPVARPRSPEEVTAEAAHMLGIRDPDRVQMFKAIVKTLQQQEPGGTE